MQTEIKAGQIWELKNLLNGESLVAYVFEVTPFNIRLKPHWTSLTSTLHRLSDIKFIERCPRGNF